MKFKWQPIIFYICKPYFFLHIYDHLCLLCLAVIYVFFFANMWENFTATDQYFTFAAILFYFTPITTYVFLVWQTDSLFLIHAHNFWNYTHMYIYTQYLYLVSVRWQSQMFQLGSYIWSFTSMITYVFFVWKTYSQELHSVCWYVCM